MLEFLLGSLRVRISLGVIAAADDEAFLRFLGAPFRASEFKRWIKTASIIPSFWDTEFSYSSFFA